MSDANRYQGTRAEHLGWALFLKFMTPAAPSPDSGDDLLLSPRQQEYSSVTFRAQIKDAKNFSVRKDLLANWLEQIHFKPVLLVRVRPVDVNMQQYELCVVHDLLLTQALWLHSCQAKAVEYITFLDTHFHAVDAIGTVLADAIVRESNRILRRESQWFDGRSPCVPLIAGDIPTYLGRLAHIEPPLAIIEEVEKSYPMQCQTFDYLRERLRGHKPTVLIADDEIQRWLHRVGATAPESEDIQTEAREFARFVKAAQGHELVEHFDFPSHRWAEISCWRVFLTLFPATYGMVATVLRDRARQWSEAQFRAALYIAGAIVHTVDTGLRNKLVTELREVDANLAQSSASKLENYLVLRGVRFARAQAEGGVQVPQARAFVQAHMEHDWESRLHQGYYGGDEKECLGALSSILASPKPRDVFMLPVIEELYAYLLERQ
jgi:hypothetical protein